MNTPLPLPLVSAPQPQWVNKRLRMHAQVQRPGLRPCGRNTPAMCKPRSGCDAEVPALIKGYLRCGGKVLGPPAWDPHFGVADLPMMLRLSELPESHKRRFIGN
jgi:hypothetical protein